MLTLEIQNMAAGEIIGPDDVCPYRWRAQVNGRTIAESGANVLHRRADGWATLVRRVANDADRQRANVRADMPGLFPEPAR